MSFLKKIYTAFKLLLLVNISSFKVLIRGFKHGSFKSSLLKLSNLISFHLHSLVIEINKLINPESENIKIIDNNFGEYDEATLTKLGQMAYDLHSILPKDAQYTYSFLISVHNPDLTLFNKSVASVLAQTAPEMEVLWGFNGAPTNELMDIIAKQTKMKPQMNVRCLDFAQTSTAHVINALAKQAKNNFIVCLEQEEILRPDFLFRYEQTLRLLKDSDNTLIYSDEYTVSHENSFKKDSDQEQLHYPYVFSTQTPNCFLLPKKLWDRVDGLRDDCGTACFYDLFLRLDLAQAQFLKLPVTLCAKKQQPLVDIHNAIQSLQNYVTQKNLDWKIEKGCLTGTLRAIPHLTEVPNIHVIIPYKNQRELTLKSVISLKNQTGVHVKITAIDNRSDDLSIAKDLHEMGVEVISINEPFNFSRLNNLAVKRSKIGADCDLLFFMNNDVELEAEALMEMSRWIDQPRIGMVGCRLHYPIGALQCGGIDFLPTAPANFMIYQQSERCSSFDDLKLQRTLRITGAIHGAAALIKKHTFLDVGGFDEIWYPNSYSDINLSIKVKSIGLYSFYTPYASGIHHESISRDIFFDDYTISTWLNQQYFQRFAKHEV